jgi:hypothetical protein
MSNRDLEFSSPETHYRADATIIWCLDNRYWQLFNKFIGDRQFLNFDPIIIAGGAQALASSENDADRIFVLNQVKKSLELHAPPLIVLMIHSDCGGYGGLANFNHDLRLEFENQVEQLRKARVALQKEIHPSIKIELVFADFNGLHYVN